MTVSVPHNTTTEEAIAIIDRSVTEIFSGQGSLELTERMRRWDGPLMDFALTASVGFISLPIEGRVIIDEILVTVHCVLPPIARTFIGEENIRVSVEQKVREILRRD
jgi:hypothetical protein